MITINLILKLCLQQYQIKMQGLTEFFSTQITPMPRQNQVSPIENSRMTRPLSPSSRFKLTKATFKQIQNSYREQLQSAHKMQKSVDSVTREAARKRMEFVKMYSQKKYKMMERQALQLSRLNKMRFQNHLKEQAKRKKLDQQLQNILLKNEEEQATLRLQAKFHQQKQARQRQFRIVTSHHQRNTMEKHSTIQQAQASFNLRKSDMQSANSSRARHNYLMKVGREVALIGQYQKLFGQIKEAGLDGDQSLKEAFLTSMTIDASIKS